MHGKSSSGCSVCYCKISTFAKRVRIVMVKFCLDFVLLFNCFYFKILCSVFNALLDDTPLPMNEASSSVLVATYSHGSLQNGKVAIGGGKPAVNGEVEKGLLTLISSDNPGLQVSVYISNDKSNMNCFNLFVGMIG